MRKKRIYRKRKDQIRRYNIEYELVDGNILEAEELQLWLPSLMAEQHIWYELSKRTMIGRSI